MHVVIVGSGIAGLTAAIRASARHDVTLVSKGSLADAATAYAQGGVAVALGADDTTLAHMEDTVVAGAGGNAARAVEVLCADGPARVRDLLALGVPFDRTTDAGSIELHGDDLARGREAAHTRWRVVHAGGDSTGAAIEDTLIAALRRQHVTILERTFLTDLVVRDGVVVGVDVLDLLGDPRRIDADAVVLASGGAGHLYRSTTNPLVATGDGVAAAWRAGAVLADLEFMQFHPTRLAVPGGGLVSEAVRGEGATLLDAAGRRFMTDVHPDAELAPRDVVARGIAAAMSAQDHRPVLLDATMLGARFLTARFPGLTAATTAAGFDWTREAVPVAPAAHYFMGGIATDADGRTSLPGLLAVGEVANTGVHGANRLASNSLLEGLVFGIRAADALGTTGPAAPALRGGTLREPTTVATRAAAPDAIRSSRTAPERVSRPAGAADLTGGTVPVPGTGLRSAVQSLMEDRVGLLRDAAGLQSARRELLDLAVPTSDGWSVREHEDRNLLTLAGLVALAAETRTESRGAHARTDHPETDPAQARPLAWVAASTRIVNTTDTAPSTSRDDRVPA
ncbi:L-aspartate oxidase [Curtobacterium sp. Leaf261]|uniref:L-aspartate oxidase n=1 Tax=Curtobacterium sp. Leaf261 TaxID=1736311 RepID=UPI0006FB2F26|nr:FAD-binding protein [Curtobacterium sp. Leaf261]KQO62392.1 L-aspartate oxidase [Curtobacterium sp. Leaf261]